MVDLFFLGVCLRVALADAFGNYTLVAFRVTRILAVLTLHAGGVFEKIAAESTSHDVVELLLDKFVAIHFVDLFFALTNSTLSAETDVDGALVTVLLVETHLQLNLAGGLQIEPAIDGAGVDLGGRRSAVGTTRLGAARGAASLGTEGSLRRAHGKLSRGGGAGDTAHFVGRDPAGTTHFGLDSLATHFLNYVGYSDPEQADGHGVLAGFVVDDDFQFVGLVYIDSVEFGFPAVVSGNFGASRHSVLDLDSHKRFGTAREASRRGVVDVVDGDDAQGEGTAEGLAEIGSINRIIWKQSARARRDSNSDGSVPSGVSELSMSICSSSYLFNACFKRTIFCLLSTLLAAASALLLRSPSIEYS